MEDSDFKKLIRNYVESDPDRDQVKRDKADFIRRKFSAGPPILVYHMVPALCVVMMLALLVTVELRGLKVESRVQSVNGTGYQSLEGTRYRSGEMLHPDLEEPRVSVERLSSKAGVPMVYQKSYQDHPITIIWVFTGG